RLLQRIGPGLITGISDDDPSAIGTYVMAGASLGYAALWTALFIFPMMIVVQYLCAKIGLMTNRGIARILKDNYPGFVVYPVVFALLITNTITAGVDLGACAAAVNLLLPISPQLIILVITLTLLAFELWGSYRLLTRIFKWLTLALL